MNPDNSEANDCILEPSKLLRRFVNDSTNSPSPRTAMPAANDANFPSNPSGILEAPSRNGLRFVMKSDKFLAISGISAITFIANFAQAHTATPKRAMKAARTTAPNNACPATSPIPEHRYKTPTKLARRMAIAAAPPIALFGSTSFNCAMTKPRTAIIAVIATSPIIEPTPSRSVSFIDFMATINAVNNITIPPTALIAEVGSNPRSKYKIPPSTPMTAVITINGFIFMSVELNDFSITANMPITTPSAIVGAIRLIGSSDDKIPSAVAMTPIAAVITINGPTDFVTSLDDLAIRANIPIKTPRAIVGAIKLVGFSMDNAAIDAAITATVTAIATMVPLTSLASFVASTNAEIITDKMTTAAKPCNNSKGSI